MKSQPILAAELPGAEKILMANSLNAQNLEAAFTTPKSQNNDHESVVDFLNGLRSSATQDNDIHASEAFFEPSASEVVRGGVNIHIGTLISDDAMSEFTTMCKVCKYSTNIYYYMVLFYRFSSTELHVQ